MASWRGIAFLWSMTSLFFLAAAVMALLGRLWLLGGFFLLVVAVGVAVGTYSYRRFHRESAQPQTRK